LSALARVLVPAVMLSIACAGPPETASLIIDDVTVIDPLTERVLSNHAVAIADGLIVGIEPSSRRGSFVAPDSIDGSGRFLIPGLMDMHVHLRTQERAASTLDLLLANGITGFRDMSAACWNENREDGFCLGAFRALAEEVAGGERAAPRPLAMSSRIVHGVSRRSELPEGSPAFLAPGTAEEGRQVAEFWNDRGVDLVKVYDTMTREAYFALLETANRIGLEVSGHLPVGVSVSEASAAGHRTIEHARDLPLACSSYEAAYRAVMARVMEGDADARRPSAEERIRSVLESFDEDLCTRVLGTLVANGTYLVPTHGTREMDFRASDPSYRADERMKYLLEERRTDWEQDLDRTAQASPALIDLYRQFYELGVRLSGRAHAAGVRVMAGTDANDTMIFPGFGLHDELARLVEAGISEMDVLKSATSTPAEYVGRSRDIGTVSVGALADLVLLNRDPLAAINNTRSIEAVLLGGRVFDRSALDGMLRGVEEAAALSRESGG